MPDIFLRQGEASPNDIKLRDPTLPDSGGAFDPANGFPWTVTTGQQDRWLAPIYYDYTDQAWAVGPPANAVQQAAWVDEGHYADQTRRDYQPEDQSWAIQPPAVPPFDPSVGFPWPPESHLPDQSVWRYDGQDGTLGQPPQNASLLAEWTAPSLEEQRDQTRADYDPSEQAWAVGPPQNADRLSAFTDPQAEPAPPPTYDPTDPWFVGPPLAAVIFDPSAGFPWPPENDHPNQARRDYQPEQQAWPVGPPQNADSLTVWTPDEHFPDQTVRAYDGQDGTFGEPPLNVVLLSAFTEPHDLPDQTVRAYDGQDAAFGIPPITPTVFDPSGGFPWTISDPVQEASQQPVWTDGQHGALGLVPPTDAAFLAPLWNAGDSQQDRSIQPVWWDPTDQPWAIGPPVIEANFAPLWNNADIQQQRGLHPVWYTPEFNNVYTAVLGFVTVVTGGLPPGGYAMSPGLSAGAYAAMPGGSASAWTPGGEAIGSGHSTGFIYGVNKWNDGGDWG